MENANRCHALTPLRRDFPARDVDRWAKLDEISGDTSDPGRTISA
jgi:hypothetical protein